MPRPVYSPMRHCTSAISILPSAKGNCTICSSRLGRWCPLGFVGIRIGAPPLAMRTWISEAIRRVRNLLFLFSYSLLPLFLPFCFFLVDFGFLMFRFVFSVSCWFFMFLMLSSVSYSGFRILIDFLLLRRIKTHFNYPFWIMDFKAVFHLVINVFSIILLQFSASSSCHW